MVGLLLQGMWLMLQQDKPDDFVLATGETHSVREFVEKAFARAGTTVQWKGDTGTVNEIGVDKNDPDHVLVKIDPNYFRPTEVSHHDAAPQRYFNHKDQLIMPFASVP